MITSALAAKPDEVGRRPANLSFKVEPKLHDNVPQVERNFDPDREVAATWFYWSPSPGVRCYTYGKATKPVEQIKLPNI